PNWKLCPLIWGCFLFQWIADYCFFSLYNTGAITFVIEVSIAIQSRKTYANQIIDCLQTLWRELPDALYGTRSSLPCRRKLSLLCAYLQRYELHFLGSLKFDASELD